MKRKYSYEFVLQFVLAAILLAVGIYMIFAEEVVYLITGVAILAFSLFRVYPLLKTLNKEVLRTINLIEIIFGVIIGVILVYASASKKLEENPEIWKQVYKYGVAFVLYVRGLVFFTSITYFEEKTEVPKFIAHIIMLTIGAMIIVTKDFNHETVATLIMIISFLGTLYLGSSGFNNYKKYREFSKELNEGKQDSKKVEKEKNKQEPILDKEEERPFIS